MSTQVPEQMVPPAPAQVGTHTPPAQPVLTGQTLPHVPQSSELLLTSMQVPSHLASVETGHSSPVKGTTSE